MGHACKLCIISVGITGRDVFATEDELFDHLEREHHTVVVREGETQEDADRRVLASDTACESCKQVIRQRLGIAAPETREITWVEIAGQRVDAHKLICESCNTMWLDTDIDTTDPVVWKASCPHCANQWEFIP